MLVLAGDSGVGKSDLLRASIFEPDALSPEPVALDHRSGALQAALLESLADALVLQARDEGGVERTSRLLAAALQKLGQARLRGIAEATLAFVEGVARDKLGDTAVDVGKHFGSVVRETADEQLVRRVTGAADEDVIRVFLALAGEARAVVGSQMVLSLDTGENLHEDDFTCLLDLVNHLPEGVQIRLAYATPTAAVADRVGRLEIAGGEIQRIEPLTDSSVTDWLKAEGLTEVQIEDVVRTTGGYPLFVTAALGYLRSGGLLTQMTGASGFQARMVAIFRSLDAQQQLSCMHLAAFTDPPEVDRVLDLLDMTTEEWVIVEGRLVDSRVFPTRVGGRAWFHELGRRAIWDRALTPEQRTLSAGKGADRILSVVQERGSGSLLEAMDFARLAALSPGFAADHAGLVAALGLSHPQLALCVSMIELTEDELAVRPHDLFVHVKATHGVPSGYERLLRETADTGLIVIVENDDAALAVASFQSFATAFALQGRSMNELGRAVVPRLAKSSLELLVLPCVPGFIVAIAGVGKASLEQASKTLSSKDFERAEGAVQFHQRWGLIAYAQVGGVDMTYQVSFEDASVRDQAVEALDGLEVTNFFRLPFKVTAVFPWPWMTPVPEQTFTLAAGRAPVGSSRSGASGRSSGDRHLDYLETMRKVHQVIAAQATPLERAVLRLEEPLGYVYYEVDDTTVTVTVRGFEDVVRIEPLSGPVFGAWARTQIAEAVGLREDQAIEHISLQFGRGMGSTRDPVAEALQGVEQRIRAFNGAQRYGRLNVPLTETGIQSAILPAMDRVSAGAAAFREAGLADAAEGPLYRSLYALIAPEPEEHGWVTGARGGVLSSEVAHESKNSVVVRLVDHVDPTLGVGEERLRQEFGLEPDRWQNSDLLFWLGRHLCFGPSTSPIRLVRSQTDDG